MTFFRCLIILLILCAVLPVTQSISSNSVGTSKSVAPIKNLVTNDYNILGSLQSRESRFYIATSVSFIKSIGYSDKIEDGNDEMETPWYLSRWILAIFIVSVMLLLSYVMMHFATGKLKRRVEELEHLQKIRTQRERISHELHDNVGTNLTHIISSLDYFAFKSGKNIELEKKAENLSEFTRDTMHELRDTIWHISVEKLTLEKFVNRIKEMCSRIKETDDAANTKVDFEGSLNAVLSPLIALNLFKVIQESVNNALKHSDAKKISIDINLNSSNDLTIKVSDDGNGNTYDESSDEGNYGLLNLRSRMDEIGATLAIESSVDKGTEVEAKLKI